MKKQNLSEQKMLTEVELELMTILWKLGEGSVQDVINQLPNERKLATTSVSTILRILEQKDILEAKKQGRGHIYVPLIDKELYESKTVKHVVDKVFDGTPMLLVKQLLNSIKLSDAELKELKNLVKEKEHKK